MPLTIGAIAVPIIMSAIGKAQAAGDEAAAKALQKQALDTINGIKTPSLAELQMGPLAKYVSAGEYTPESEQVVNAGPSEMGNISTDPRLKQAQMVALSKLQSMGTGGLQPQDLAALAQVKQAAEAQAQAQQASILQNMQQRGIGGSGSELAAKLASGQSAANRQATEGLTTQGQAAQRALQAIMQSGQLGGQMQEQEFGQKAQQAKAQDIINQYNAMNSQQVLGRNTGARNAAQQANLAAAQALSNANTSGVNQVAMYNAALPQQMFGNTLQKNGMQYTAENNAAGQAQQQAQNTQHLYGTLGQGIGQGMQAAGQYKNNADQTAAYGKRTDLEEAARQKKMNQGMSNDEYGED